MAVGDIALTGQHFELVPDSEVRAAVARFAGLRDLLRFQGSFDVSRHGVAGLHVRGSISATVGQNCVVTLEPLENDIEEAIDLVFLPPPDPPPPGKEPEAEPREPKWDDAEPLIGGIVDLGMLATEFLMLGIDPYPRKPGAVFEPLPDHKPDGGPFAALAKLTKDRQRS